MKAGLPKKDSYSVVAIVWSADRFAWTSVLYKEDGRYSAAISVDHPLDLVDDWLKVKKWGV